MLLSAPPGQFDVVLDRMKTILPTAITEEWTHMVRKEYNMTSGSDIVIESRDSSVSDPSCKALKEAIMKTKSGKPHCRIDHSSEAGKETFEVSIYRENIQLTKSYSASSLEKYTLSILPGMRNSGTLVGSIQIKSHTFEDGNIQMELYHKFDKKDVDSSKDFEIIARQLDTWEKDVLSSLRENYNNMDSRLKCLRRTLPITRTRMDWNLQPHRMIKTLHSDTNNGR